MTRVEVLDDSDEALLEYLHANIRMDSRFRDAELGLDDMHRHDEMVGEHVRYVVRDGDRHIALAHVSGAYYDPECATLPCYVNVAAEHRGHGIGAQLYERVVEWARDARGEHVQLSTVIPEADDPAIAWWRRRGLEVTDRYVTSELVIDAAPQTPEPIVDGVRIATLEDRPDLEDAAYEVFAQTWRDMPGQDFAPTPREAWTRAQREGRRSASAWAFVVAGDDVLGVCTTAFNDGDNDAHTGFLGVREDARGRGIASLLKHHQIEWCRTSGAVRLRTNNHDDNAAMRRANERAGFVELPAQLLLVGAPLDTPPLR